MKKFFIIFSLVLPFVAYAQQEEKVDTIPSTRLDEVVVTADAQIETAKKVILNPTKLDKKHSTNGYTLLENMNLPDFNVNPKGQTITTTTGRNVIILVNGVEVSADELGTLAASEIMQIQYQRNPGGKWVSSGAVINFITVQYDYGGNVYLSADEGLARQYGNYIGMVNYKKKAVTLTLTANGEWDNYSQLNSAENTAIFSDGNLYQTINPTTATTHRNSEYLKFKFSHAADNHTLDISALLQRRATPRNFMADRITYSGLYDFTSNVERSSKDTGILPAIGLQYNLFLPKGHTLMMSGELSYGHTNYKSLRTETGFDDIVNNAVENSFKARGNISLFKSLPHNFSLGVTLDDYYNCFRDAYSGSFDRKQTLTNNRTMVLFHIDQNIPVGLSYYLSAGISNLYSTIGNHHDNQLSPMAFYGLTYAVNQKHSFSISGTYSHNIYDPSYKNNAVIRTSFFETTIGNLELEQLKVFQNFISYNGRVGHFGFSFTYDFLKYFDNTSNRYYTEDNVMCRQLINDGDFYYNKLIFGISANFLNNKLRLNGNAIYSVNHFNSEYRPAKSNDWRADFSASYMFGDWQVKGIYAIPYKVLGIEGTEIHNPAQYGLSLSWQHGNWAAECSVENFLDHRLCTRTDANYGVYKSLARSLSDLKGRNISVSVTYILPYGKKTDRGRVETNTNINSAILRPF